MYGDNNQLLPGPPFAFGAILVLLAILVAWFIPENPKSTVTKLIPTALSSDNDGPIATEAYEHTRWDIPAADYSHLPSGYDGALETGDHDSYYASSSQALLFDPKTHIKHTRIWDDKDHAIASGDLGLWDRLISGWSDRRRRAVPIAARRANRLARYPPTISFARAHLVEPIRRLIGGWSALGRSTDNATHVFSGRSTFDHSVFSSGASAASSTTVPTLGNSGGSIEPLGLDGFLSKHESDPQFLTRLDAEAADLSNYRSHKLKHFLHHSTPTECDVVTAHRFDTTHQQTRVYVANTATTTTEATDNVPGVMGSVCAHNMDGYNSMFLMHADCVHKDDENSLPVDNTSTVPDSVVTLVDLPENSGPHGVAHYPHSHHLQQFGLDESNRLAVLPT
ncbi:hypothetical protein D915_006634 [Fasciola hepatica]|uniref:Transmembrane protein n=1 Tax=Fasciola hepatica TaxID=6192 RepID=A0A4E0RND5_FASHE|nr:hypothetical protein D915_006634 [Fasciola hepatica]